MNRILDKKYKKIYEEDKNYIEKLFNSFFIPSNIKKLYLDNLLSGYKNIEDINLISILNQTTERILYMPDGDKLSYRQRMAIKSGTKYLKTMYNIRIKRGDIKDGSANDKCSK